MAEDRLCPGLADPNVPVGLKRHFSMAMRRHQADAKACLTHLSSVKSYAELNQMRSSCTGSNESPD